MTDFDLKKLKEKDFQKIVVDYAKACGWYVHHTPDSRRSIGNGWPDLVLMRENEIFFAELKAHRGVLSDAQKEVITMLTLSGQEVYVYRPLDLEIIKRRLTKPRK